MPVLSFHEGISELSFLLLENPGDLENSKKLSYPYTYSEKLFGRSFTKQEYYNTLFQTVANEFGIKLSDVEIFASGVLSVPEVPIEPTKKAYLINSIPENYIYLSSNIFAVGNDYIFAYPLSDIDPEDNSKANLAIYSNVNYHETSDVLAKDSILRNFSTNFVLEPREVVITGERCSDKRISAAITHLLIIDILRESGIFNIKLDEENNFVHSFMFESFEPQSISIGTLINSPGKTECLYETDVGTKQLIDLDAGKLFIIPLDAGSTARVMVKSSGWKGEKVVYGGELGVILDTREKSNGGVFKEMYADVVNKSLHRL